MSLKNHFFIFLVLLSLTILTKGQPFLVSADSSYTFSTIAQSLPAPPLELSNGNVFITWAGQSSTDTSTEIYGTILSPGGTSIILPAFLINPNVGYNFNGYFQSSPMATLLYNTSIIVTWSGTANTVSSSSIFGVVLSGDNSATVIRNPFIISTDGGAQTFTGYAQKNPFLLRIANQQILVCWSGSSNNSATYTQIYAVVLSPATTSIVTQPFLVSSNGGAQTFTIYNQENPVATYVQQFECVIAWSGTSSVSTSYSQIYFALYFSTMTVFQQPKLASADYSGQAFNSYNQKLPQVQAFYNGYCMISWYGEAAAGGKKIFSTILATPYGNSLYRIPSLLLGTGSNTNLIYSLVPLLNGEIFTAYQYDNGGVVKVAGAGFTYTQSSTISTFDIPTDGTTIYSTYSQYAPVASQLESGTVFACWYGTNSLNANKQIYGQVIPCTSINNCLPSPLIEPLLINVNSASLTFSANLQNFIANPIQLPTGNIFIAWSGFVNLDSITSVYGAVFSSQATIITSVFLISKNGVYNFNSYAQRSPMSCLLQSGDALVVWSGGSLSTTSNQIFGSVFSSSDATSVILTPFIISTNGGSQSFATFYQNYPYVSTLLNGEVLICWSGQSSTNSIYQIYAVVLSADTTTIIGQPFLVSSNGGAQTFSSYSQGSPASATMQNGNLIIAWIGVSSVTTGHYQVYGVLFSGTSPFFIIQQPWLISTDNGMTFSGYGQGRNNESPLIGIFKSGKIFICWTGTSNLGVDGLAYRILSSDASNIEFAPSSFISTVDQEPGGVVALTNGEIFVSFQSEFITPKGTSFSDSGSNTISSFSIMVDDLDIYTNRFQTKVKSCRLNSGDLATCWTGQARENQEPQILCQFVSHSVIKEYPTITATINICTSSADCSINYVCIDSVCVQPQGSTITTVTTTTSTTISYAGQAVLVANPASISAISRTLFINMLLYLRYLEVDYPDNLKEFFYNTNIT